MGEGQGQLGVLEGLEPPPFLPPPGPLGWLHASAMGSALVCLLRLLWPRAGEPHSLARVPWGVEVVGVGGWVYSVGRLGQKWVWAGQCRSP